MGSRTVWEVVPPNFCALERRNIRQSSYSAAQSVHRMGGTLLRKEVVAAGGSVLVRHSYPGRGTWRLAGGRRAFAAHRRLNANKNFRTPKWVRSSVHVNRGAVHRIRIHQKVWVQRIRRPDFPALESEVGTTHFEHRHAENCRQSRFSARKRQSGWVAPCPPS